MFADDEQKEKGQKRAAMPAYTPFIERVTQGQGEIDAGLTDDLGGVLMRGAWVDLKRLLADERARWRLQGFFLPRTSIPRRCWSGQKA